MDDPAARLVLGTAQLGMDYGIANRAGRPDRKAVDSLLRLAHAEGVRTLDTAQAYGESEAVIGDFLRRHPQLDFEVVSKLAPEFAEDGAEGIEKVVRQSYDRLGGQLSIMLMHDPSMLAHWDRGLRDVFGRCVSNGWIKAAGASVYNADQFADALDLEGIEAIQISFNVFDRKILELGLLDLAQEKGKQVFLRSVFLQGLLLMEAEYIPPALAFSGETLRRWRAVCVQWDHLPASAALLFAATAAPAALLVIGCETSGQLGANLAAIRNEPLETGFMNALLSLPPGEEKLIRPYLWG